MLLSQLKVAATTLEKVYLARCMGTAILRKFVSTWPAHAATHAAKAKALKIKGIVKQRVMRNKG